MKRVCPKCSYSAICVSAGFDVLFNACALQFASQYMETPQHTSDETRIRRSAQIVVKAVQQVLPIGCPELQPDTLRKVCLGKPPAFGPTVDVVVRKPW